MRNQIDFIQPSEYEEAVDLWEASVRATHHFLKEEDIQFFKPLILNEYLKMVDLRCLRDDDGSILGFLGVVEDQIEMLFIHPHSRGMGIGRRLIKYAIEELKTTKVDVNEDNPEALIFYEHYGFKVIDRSELDPTGRPYPVLHMALNGK